MADPVQPTNPKTGRHGIAVCEHGTAVRINDDGSMLTVCRVCRERIRRLASDDRRPTADE